MRHLRLTLFIALAVALAAPLVLAQPPGPPPGDPHGLQRGPGDGPPRGPHGPAGPRGPGGPHGAQRGPGFGAPPFAEDGNGRELLMQVMVARLSRELELSDEDTVLMVREFADFQERMQDLHQEHRDLSVELRELVERGAPEDTIEAKLDALVEHEEAIADAQQEVYEEMADGLSVENRARLYLFMDEFKRDMRRLVQRAQQRHWGSGRDPGMRRGPDRPGGRGEFRGPRGPGERDRPDRPRRGPGRGGPPPPPPAGGPSE